MQFSDQQLVKKFKGGDVRAFEELVGRYEKRVYSLAYRFTGNHADAGDMVQEVFIRVYRALPKFREESSFSTWIYKVAANVCRDELRRKRKRKSVSLDDMEANQGEFVIADGTQSPEEFAERRDLQTRVQKYINQLSEEQRLILLLREMQKLSYEEIAQVLDCSLGTVKSRLSRARTALKNKMKAAGELSQGGQVKNFDEAKQKITAITGKYKGLFIEKKQNSLTVGFSSQSFEDALTEISKINSLLSRQSEDRDVTENYNNISSALARLYAEEQQLSQKQNLTPDDNELLNKTKTKIKEYEKRLHQIDSMLNKKIVEIYLKPF